MYSMLFSLPQKWLSDLYTPVLKMLLQQALDLYRQKLPKPEYPVQFQQILVRYGWKMEEFDPSINRQASYQKEKLKNKDLHQLLTNIDNMIPNFMPTRNGSIPVTQQVLGNKQVAIYLAQCSMPVQAVHPNKSTPEL